MGFNPHDWLEGNIIGVTKCSPTQSNPVIFINTHTNTMSSFGKSMHSLPDQWTTVSVASHVPNNTIAIFITGLLIITHGTTQETADLQVFFRANDATTDYNYNWQTVEASVGNGQRSTMAVWIPLNTDREFDFKWHRSTIGQYPDNSAYGVNLSLNAYLRT